MGIRRIVGSIERDRFEERVRGSDRFVRIRLENRRESLRKFEVLGRRSIGLFRLEREKDARAKRAVERKVGRGKFFRKRIPMVTLQNQLDLGRYIRIDL